MAKKSQARKKTAKTAGSLTARKRAPARRKAAQPKKVALSVDPRHESYQQALRQYEQALETLQRHDFPTAVVMFRQIIDQFPEERELHERSRLYIRACERELTPSPTPETIEEQVYAATLALNAGAEEEALRHLEDALSREPDNDQVQYMLAVARAASGESLAAVGHLQRAIALKPENRFLARQEPNFDHLRQDEEFQQVVMDPPGSSPARRAGNYSSL